MYMKLYRANQVNLSSNLRICWDNAWSVVSSLALADPRLTLGYHRSGRNASFLNHSCDLAETGTILPGALSTNSPGVGDFNAWCPCSLGSLQATH